MKLTLAAAALCLIAVVAVPGTAAPGMADAGLASPAVASPMAVPGTAAAGTAAEFAATNGLGPGAGNGHGHGLWRWCAEKFDEAQRADMESFRDFDSETWEEGHDPDAVSIYPSGARFAGIDDIMAAQESHFENKEAIWSWTEVNRRVDGCRTAFIEYIAIYEIPRTGYYQKALTVVTYIWTRHGWRSILDQGTMLELRTG